MKRKTATIFILAIVLFGGLAALFNAPLKAAEQKVHVGVIESPPFAFKDQIGNWEGIAVDLWKASAEKLGLAYEWIELNKDTASEALIQKKVDVLVGGISVTPERIKVIDFTQPFFATELGIGIMKDPSQSLVGSLLETFFSLQFLSLVGGLLILLIVIGLVIWLIESKNGNEDFNPDLKQGALHGIFWSVAMMTGSGEKAPRSIPGKIIAILWIFAGLFITSAFIASVTTLLTSSHYVAKVNNERDLAQVRVGVLQGTHESFLRALGASVKPSANIAEGLEELTQGKTDAFVMSAPVLKYYSGKLHHGKIDIIPMSNEQVFFAFGLRRGDPFLAPLDVQVVQIVQSPAWKEVLDEYLNY
ncbi:MAG: transporter substrate-binding domain-containing protein [Candidatus Omnitrophica bacterium]|nr:transporter substrate-binding domain-containing protein [Candidatus Omnitrophota bacterium]